MATSLRAARLFTTTTRTVWSGWGGVTAAPPDPILGLSQAFAADKDSKKVNLGVGAYRDDKNAPYILNCVQKATKKIIDANHEYAGIAGVPALNKVSAELVFGENAQVLAEKRNVTVQAISGTGALRVAGEFLARFQPGTPIYLPNPTWANHIPIFKDSGMEVKSYTYYNPENCGLNFAGLTKDLKDAPEGSIILFHACAHNPTGVDPNLEQWKELSLLCKDKKHFALFDLAYQGFASGDCERDAAPIRIFTADGHQVGVCQSFAKNFGLYGQRVGSLTFLTANEKEAEIVRSQLWALIRPIYSNPPVFGARIVSTVLEDPELKAEWYREIKVMSGRIIEMRHALVNGLKEAGSKRDWSHIINQIGMFCFTGLKPEQCDTLKEQYHIYLTRNGRVSVAGLTSSNVQYVANAIHEVSKN